MRIFAILLLATACSGGPDLDGRQQRIVTALTEDNYMWSHREPALVTMKLHKMQRTPFDWLRGTAALYWRDIMEPGVDRPTTTFGSPASSRVLLVGDPHPENVGTFHADDGTMFIDWNDFDASGYGPFTGDLRRLGAGLAIIVNDPDLSAMVVREAMTSYAATIVALSTRTEVGPLVRGRAALFDDALDKALTRGTTHDAVGELAPITDGARALAVGDLSPVPDDGVIEDRIADVSADEAAWIDGAIAQWQPTHLSSAAAKILFRARRIGSGVSSFAALRYDAVLAGETDAPDDDRIIELKETRDGLIIVGQPRFAAAEWDSPAARSVNTQRRLQALPGDALLGEALVGALSLKIRDREAFQRGIDRDELSVLVSNRQKDIEQLRVVGAAYGELLARAHGVALTQDGVAGWTVIAPLISTRDGEFVDELTALSLGDAAQITDDHVRMSSFDLASLVIPESL